MNVAFVNENALGHGSYLPRFVDEFRNRPELGIVPHLIDVVPMPPAIQRRADFTVRGLRRFGLDFHVARWRRVASRHARERVDELLRRQRIDAVVVNTQSVGLFLGNLPGNPPLHVGLDATFRQLARTRWFAANRIAAWFLPWTLAPILGLERRLFGAASRLWPWSALVRDSLIRDYGFPADRISVLPPSLDLEGIRLKPNTDRRGAGERRQILFIGGDFRRKGGPALLEAFRSGLVSRADLHVVTQSDLGSEPGLMVHRGVSAQSDAWLERWSEADVFVFPSTLETFGIVLVEALAFGVPVVSSRAGAAADILEEGRAGILVDPVTPAALAASVCAVLDDPRAALARAEVGRDRVARCHDLRRNAARLADRLKERAVR
ncbi:MAG: glycosyltransferase family 4 protein [Limisphaerales bacterium]